MNPFKFTNMSNNQFSILYDGVPVDEGTIDARDLAPALLAFAELVDQSAPFVDERFPHLTVRVRSGFEKGSFEIFLEVATLYDKFINLFTSPDLQALAMLLAMLGINGAPGLFQLIKKSKGRMKWTPASRQNRVEFKLVTHLVHAAD